MAELRGLLEEVLGGYLNARTSGQFGTTHPMWRLFGTLAEELALTSPIRGRSTIRVKKSVGTGGWAAVPWIAFLDGRETTTTRRGVYPCYLFRSDMAGVYLTLMQGVSDVRAQLGPLAAGPALVSRAEFLAQKHCQRMLRRGFALDRSISLGASGLAADYEAGTIAHKFYATGGLPCDDLLVADLEAVLESYDTYLGSVGEADRRVGDATSSEGAATPARQAQDPIVTARPGRGSREVAGWHGSIGEFLELGEDAFVGALSAHLRRCMGMGPDGLQVTAWRNEFAVLRQTMSAVLGRRSVAAGWHVVFEYELPRERGRRPDVVLLTGSQVIVLEFKDAERQQLAHVDQVAAYSRDLSEYHAESHDKLVDPVLVLTRSASVEVCRRESRGEPEAVLDPRAIEPSPYEVTVTGPAALGRVILALEARAPAEPVCAEEWLAADYQPLPSLVRAARLIFDHEPLPRIKRAESAGIPETVAALVRAAEAARERGEHHLALVTGVPGSGKTLVGLQFVYQDHFGDTGSERTAVLLSGNGPLVKVLQYALKSRVFVQDVHAFLKSYGGRGGVTPEEHVWVYDEAQRAWDAEQAGSKHREFGEPEDFLRIGRRKSWALMVGLVGQGQEIHVGEEAGLGQWNDAMAAAGGRWTVHCSSKLASRFPAATTFQVDDHLDLTTSLRTHVAEDVQTWVDMVLEGDLYRAGAVSERLDAQGFVLYLTRDLDAAKHYARERYAAQEVSRYGLIASSKARLEEYGIDAGYLAGRGVQVEKWFYDGPDQVRSCCQLSVPVSEFQCQGLELDLPIVCWGKDLWWSDGRWATRPSPRNKARDPHRLRLNTYRVLLTRGRDGMVIWMPKGSRHSHETFAALQEVGLKSLS